MNNLATNDTGIFYTVLERFEKQHLPRVIEIQQRLDQGLELNEFEIEFLCEVLHDSGLLLPFIERHPEYQKWFADCVHYYNLVVDQAAQVNNGNEVQFTH